MTELIMKLKHSYIVTRIFPLRFVATLGGLLLLASCSETGGDASEESSADTGHSKIQRVEVVHPQSNSFSSQILISGVAKPDKEVMIHSMENGVVKQMLVDIGAFVKKGGLLARLDNPELRRKQQQLNAEVEGKRSVYERLQSAYDASPAITPAQVVEDAKAEYMSLQAQLDAANDRLSFLSIRAPFAGVITQRFVDEGALVQSAMSSSNARALFEIQDLDPIRLSIPLPERDAGFVTTGMEAVVTFPEIPGESFTAPVSRSSNSLDKDSKTMQVEIDLDNSKGRLKPGMYAKAQMQLNNREGVLSLPVTAQVIFRDEACILIVKDGVVERVPARKGLTNKDYFEVMNPAITEKTLVIIQGKGLVKPGDNVEAVLKN